MPAPFESSIPHTKTGNFDWVSQDHAYLFRHLRSAAEESELAKLPPRVEHFVRPMKFGTQPKFTLAWGESGHSLVLFLNGEPWAFIAEETRTGYSKGILQPTIGLPWDQCLFERAFPTP